MECFFWIARQCTLLSCFPVIALCNVVLLAKQCAVLYCNLLDSVLCYVVV